MELGKVYTVIDKVTGQELYAKLDNEVTDTQLAVEELRTEGMVNPYFDFQTRTFYDKPVEE
jgi:hypothetical protein